MLFTTEQQLKEHFVKKHLLRYGMTHDELEGLSYKEMKKKLALARALEVKVDGPEKSWF